MKQKNTLIIVVITIVLFIIIGLIFGKNLFPKQSNLEDIRQKVTDEIFINILAHGFVWKNELAEEDSHLSEESKFILSSKMNTLLREYHITEEDILTYENILNEKFENDPKYYDNVAEKFEKRVLELESSN